MHDKRKGSALSCRTCSNFCGLLAEKLHAFDGGGVQGVSVAAFQSDEFPAFFTPHSGCAAPGRVDSPQQAARMIQASQRLDLGGGLLFGGLFIETPTSIWVPSKLQISVESGN